jgi:Flp pilus assembly protein TadG
MTAVVSATRVTRRLRRAAATAAARWRGDRGTVSVELAIGVPMLVLTVLFAAAAFVMARANLDVNSAASAGARAASLARSAPAARTAANDAANTNLAGRCTRLSVEVDTGGFHRGGQVRVTVSCTVTTHGLTGIGLPGNTTFTATATSPIDVYRHVALGFAARKAPPPGTEATVVERERVAVPRLPVRRVRAGRPAGRRHPTPTR